MTPPPPGSTRAPPPSLASGSQDRVQRATTSAAVLQARERAAAAKNRVPPPKGRKLRLMQKAELQQRVAESKVIWLISCLLVFLLAEKHFSSLLLSFGLSSPKPFIFLFAAAALLATAAVSELPIGFRFYHQIWIKMHVRTQARSLFDCLFSLSFLHSSSHIFIARVILS